MGNFSKVRKRKAVQKPQLRCFISRCAKTCLSTPAPEARTSALSDLPCCQTSTQATVCFCAALRPQSVARPCSSARLPCCLHQSTFDALTLSPEERHRTESEGWCGQQRKRPEHRRRNRPKVRSPLRLLAIRRGGARAAVIVVSSIHLPRVTARTVFRTACFGLCCVI
jgi:hypothetical protein